MAQKSDEQIARDFQDAEFREIEIRDASPRPNQPIQPNYVIGQPVYQPANTGFHPMYMQAPITSQGTQPPYYPQQYPAEGMPYNQPTVNAISPQDEKFLRILHFARFVRWMAVFDCIIIFLFILGGLIFLLILVPLPIMGYFSGRYLNRHLAMAYMVFIVLIIALRIAVMAIVDYLAFYILTIIVILIELIILRYVLIFFKLLGTISLDERRQLLTIQNGPIARLPNMVNNPAPQQV